MSLEAQAVKGPATAGEAAVAALEVIEVPMAPVAPVASLVGGKKETTKAHAGVVPAGMYSTVFNALRYQYDNDADSTGSTGCVAAAFTAMDEVTEGGGEERGGAGKGIEAEDIAEDTGEFGGELRCCICLEGFEAGDTLRKVRRAREREREREKREDSRQRREHHSYHYSFVQVNQIPSNTHISLSYSASLPRSSFALTFLSILFAVASVRALFSLRVHLAVADIVFKLVPNRSPSCHWGQGGRDWKHRRYPHNCRSHNSSDGEGG
jgi:hypothetical protein